MSKNIVVRVCTGTGGIAAGGDQVISSFKASLSSVDVKAHVDGTCSAHKVGCCGFCSLDVLVDVVIDNVKTTYKHVKPDMVQRIVEEHIAKGKPVQEWLAGEDYTRTQEKQTKVVRSFCGEIDPEDINAYISVGGYKAARKALSSMTSDEIIDVVRQSYLRGRGGAGFPTSLKWEHCLRIKSDIKYVVCNGNESDPGAFMDTSLMEGDPHSIIEGMIICAKAVESQHGYIYLKSEYSLAIERLERAITQCYEKGFLGKNIFGTDVSFDLKVFKGMGAFVCGEATALMRSIEGKRGMPNPRLWRTVEKGLWEKPTVLNNVETFVNIPRILENDPKWFRNLGTDTSGGTKVFSLSGNVKNTGLIEVPLGISLREIIYDIGGGIANGKEFKAVHIGGPSGGCIPAYHIDMELDYESLARANSMMGSGGMVVLDDSNCMVNTTKFFIDFLQAESCGKCIPCRIGTKRMLEILERITAGQGEDGDIELLEELARYIRATSLCGFGMTAPNPVLSTIRYFRSEYEVHIKRKKCPAAVCKDLITYSILQDNCTGCGACRRACPSDAIRGTKKKPHQIVAGICIKCGTCFDVCKFKAVTKS